MLGMLLGESFELNPLKQLIVERTGGNPFFIEEIVQALFGEGALVRNGVVKVAHPLPRLRLPPTVQGILAARIDRLSTAQKDLLQTLAVIGGVSSLDLLRQVASTDQTQLEQRLAELQVGEFVYQQPAAGDVEYVFKHALTQEVAYSSVLSERRKALHDRVARGLETLFANSIDEHLTELAYHYSRGSRDDEAVKYLVRAGEQALQLSAFSQAATYLEGGLTRLEQLPISSERDVAEIAIRRNLADVTMVTRGYAAPEYERHLVRRHELADRLRDNTQIFYSLVGISIFSAFRLELGKAQEIGTKLLEIAA